MSTTIGRLLVNRELPKEFQTEAVLNKDEADNILAQIAQKYPERYRAISHALMQLGTDAVYTEGTTLRLSDTRLPIDRKPYIDHIIKQSRRIAADPTLNKDQKAQAIEGVYTAVQDELKKLSYQAALAQGNPFALQVKSKARGNQSQLAALMTTPGLYEDANGQIIPTFIRRSYAEGLKPHEYWAGTYGARKSVISTKFCLASGTLVLTHPGCREVPIEQLKAGDWVYTLNEQDRLIPTRVTAVTSIGMLPCMSYRFGTDVVSGTPEHNIQLERRSVFTGLVRSLEPLSHAKMGRRGAVLPAGMSDVGMEFEGRALLLGALLGDGGLTTQQTKLYLSDTMLVGALESVAEQYNLKLHADEERATVTVYSVQELERSSGIGGGHKTPFRAWLDELGLLDKYAHEKTIPDVVYSWNRESVGALVAGLWATDGCTTRVRNARGCTYAVVTFYCTSESLARGLKKLLARKLGVYSTPVGTRNVSGDISRFADGHIAVRNHNLHGFSINDVTSLRRLSEACPPVADKIVRLKTALASRIVRRMPNRLAAYKDEMDIGLQSVHDIEVAAASHCFVLANGFVVSNSTRDAGYLGKQFGTAASAVLVTEDDCGTAGGIPVKADDLDNVGVVLARDVGKFKAGTIVTRPILAELKKRDESIVVRSPITCSAKQGVCKYCAGVRESGDFPEIGYNIGINAASALAERIAQSSLNTKHSGGIVNAKGEVVYAGFPVVEQLAQVPATFPNAAPIASLDGRVDEIREAPQGGQLISVDGTTHYVPAGRNLLVKVGDRVEAGDQLAGGLVNPSEIVKYKGIGEGRRYFAERMTQAFRDSGFDVSRRNVEVLSRAMIDHVISDDVDGTDASMAGEPVSYTTLAQQYRPRADAAMVDAQQALGQYLEQPVLHYTIGTRVTRKVADQLKQFGHNRVMVHAKAPPFEPHMLSLREIPQHERDWVAQLGSNYLKPGLLKNVHRAAESHLHGMHPIPAIAKGTEIGNVPKGQAGY